ncbi:MAG: alpha-galactosidase, partial [Sporichthyaceae bacterium]|nr:alpha-galactosidase [Sporichthyaceae bacterium]
FQVERRPLQAGKFVTETRRGHTSIEANPWFAVTPAGDGDGRVWFGALAWSGNWSIVFETERNGALHLVAGIQPFDFSWHLEPGEELATPPLVCGYTEGGLGEASRRLHAYQVAEVLPANHRETLRPVHYNSWFATRFEVVAEHQIMLARAAAELGVELFVVDDGWFGARASDRAGLGDWVVSAQRFPNGLGELIDEVHRLGMRFGIWVEPEMVSPDSDVYRTHPDWIFHFPGTEPTLSRNQLVLNLARDDTRAHLLDALRSLLRDHDIDYLKIDHNRPWTDVGWPAAPPERQREVWVRHVRGLYELLASLRREFPRLLVETCAGGGGRVDLGILGLT